MILNHIAIDVIYGEVTPSENHSSFLSLSSKWIIYHGFNIRHGIIVRCTDRHHKTLKEDEDYIVNFIDMNQLEIVFEKPMSGFCICSHFQGHQSIESIKSSTVLESLTQLIDALEIDDLKRIYPEMNSLKSKIEEKILLGS